MEEISADVVVIGSGPAGQKAAIQAAKLGKKVIVVEKHDEPGGNCLFSGTIPSKTLREAIIDLTRFHERSFYAFDYHLGDITIGALNNRLNKVVEEEKNMIYRQFKKNNIRLLTGSARFENPHMLILVDPDYRLLFQIQSTSFIIATGSKPRNPNNVPFDTEVILDSTTLLGMQTVPKSLLVLGGGIIGSRICQLFLPSAQKSPSSIKKITSFPCSMQKSASTYKQLLLI